MKVYSVVMQWTDNSMAIPKYPKKVYAIYKNFNAAKKLRDRLRALDKKDMDVYIREDEIELPDPAKVIESLALDIESQEDLYVPESPQK